jgi:ketosteroid isomerase-like protein
VIEAEPVLRRAYEAFNAGDIEGALALMHPDVDWPDGMDIQEPEAGT